MGFVAGDGRACADDAHLALLLLPVEAQGGVRIMIKVLAFWAHQVGVKAEPFFAVAFEEHHANVRSASCVHSGEATGTRFESVLLGILLPALIPAME